jgi:3-dehydroquinate synthase
MGPRRVRCATFLFPMATIRIKSSRGSYQVYCSRGALARAGSVLTRLPDASGTFVISSPNVWRYWGNTFLKKVGGLRSKNIFLIDDRERAKNLDTVELLCRALTHAGADRRSTIVAVGGGVVGDVAGFTAASYLRGVRLVQVPTTLVAQVDSAVGGKTGVNLPEGKNLVGAFYAPDAVIADMETLGTLPHREYRSGLYEVIKYGAIADAGLFTFLERNMLALLRRDAAALEHVIYRCIRIKAHIVERDERESGLREILNYGHTFGHALEAATGYRRFLHGEAIGWGMHVATMLGAATGRIGDAQAARVIRLVASVGPLPAIGKIPAAHLRKLLAGDKKTRGGEVRWVLLQKIGKAQRGIVLPWKLIARTISELPEIAAKARS